MNKLPRLSANQAIVDGGSGKALLTFTRLWEQLVSKIEISITVLTTGFVVSLGSGNAVSRTLAAGTGLNISDGDGVAGNPTYSLANTAITPATYGDGTHVAQPTFDAQGRATHCANVAIIYPVSSVFGRTGAVVAVANDYSFAQISGSVAASQLPNPGASSLGGVESSAPVAHNFLTGISTGGAPSKAQPDFTDLTGAIANAQLPASGAWTPADHSGGSMGAITIISAKLVDLGAAVFFEARISYPSNSDATVAKINGLPSAPSVASAVTILFTSGWNTTTVVGTLSTGGDIEFNSLASNLTNAQLSASGFVMTGFYFK